MCYVIGYEKIQVADMFLRKNYSQKTGRTHLAIAHGYRDADGKNKHKTVKTLGYLDELQKQFPDPITHFTEIARQMDGWGVKSTF